MHSSVSAVPIGEVVHPVRSWNPHSLTDGETIDYIDIGSVSQTEKEIVPTPPIDAATAPSRARQLIAADDILVSTVRPNLNGVARVAEHLDGATASTGFCVLRPNPKRLDPSYLFHWVRAPAFIEEMTRSATGQSYPAVSDRIIKQSPIPLPPLPEQKRIAAILDQADALRRLRRRAIDRLNTLGQAIFQEMFGDVTANPSGWEERRLGEVADVASGITKGRKTGAPTRLVPYLAVANVQDRHLKLDAVKTIEATEDEMARFRLRRDDLLLTEGGDPDKLGRGTLWAEEIPECIHQNHIFRVRVTSPALRPVFLNWIVGSERGKRYFFRSSKQTTGIASINKTQLNEFPLLVPALDMQTRFEERLREVGDMTQHFGSAFSGTDSLFASLQHRAFTGQL